MTTWPFPCVPDFSVYSSARTDQGERATRRIDKQQGQRDIRFECKGIASVNSSDWNCRARSRMSANGFDSLTTTEPSITWGKEAGVNSPYRVLPPAFSGR